MPLNIQIIGTKKSNDTRKAERFFKERRVPFHFRDVAEKALSPGELENITRKITADELIDTAGKEYQHLQLQYKVFDAAEELLAHSELLKAPVVRNGSDVTLGYQPDVWAQWIAKNK